MRQYPVTEEIPGRPDRVLLLGVARSGTSWLGRALGQADGVRYLYEPDNVDADPTGKGRPGGLGYGPYPLIEPGEEAGAFGPLWDLVFSGRMPLRRGWKLHAGRAILRLPSGLRDPLIQRGARLAAEIPGPTRRTIVKTIYGLFALDWLVERYNPRVVVIERNPLNVVSSWLELSIPTFDLMTRPEIQERHLTRLGIEPPPSVASQLVRTAWCVGLLTTMLSEGLTRHPGWLFVSHEELCADPTGGIGAVYQSLGLSWTEAATRFLVDADRPGEGLQPIRVTKDQPERWRKRLNPSQAHEILDVLDQFPSAGRVRPPALARDSLGARG